MSTTQKKWTAASVQTCFSAPHWNPVYSSARLMYRWNHESSSWVMFWCRSLALVLSVSDDWVWCVIGDVWCCQMKVESRALLSWALRARASNSCLIRADFSCSSWVMRSLFSVTSCKDKHHVRTHIWTYQELTAFNFISRDLTTFKIIRAQILPS